MAADSAKVRRLVAELDAAKKAQARAYLEARSKSAPSGRPVSEEDARMAARIALERQKTRDPEVIRFDLAAALGAVPRWGDD